MAGVKGMKWGVRKATKRKSGRRKSTLSKRQRWALYGKK